MSQQPTPYLGSKISLISKSEIRYEGILYTVDQKDATIALAKVKSFGTEDRPTEHPVAPREDVYEYIIFKASDIKDLMVCETPKPVPQLCPGLPYDPAIVSVSQQSQSQSLVSGLTAGVPQGGKQLLGSGSSSRSGTPGHRSVSPTIDAGVQTGSSSHNRAPGAGRHVVANRSQTQQQKRQSAPQQQSHRGQGQQERGGFRQQQSSSNQQSYRNVVVGGQNRRAGESGLSRGGFDHSRRYDQRSPLVQGYRSTNFSGQRLTSGRGAPQRRQQSQQQPLKFDSDYDFEKANEQFKETLNHLKDEFTSKSKLSDDEKEGGEKKSDSGADLNAGEVESEPAAEEKTPQFYDKSSSFFDRISCEALERQEGKNDRPNWRKERETNLETFGQAALRNYQYRRGGNRGVGGFRGRSGGNMAYGSGYGYRTAGYRGSRSGYNNYYPQRGGYYYYHRY